MKSELETQEMQDADEPAKSKHGKGDKVWMRGKTEQGSEVVSSVVTLPYLTLR